jgi:soluble lytic murein transglycosylase
VAVAIVREARIHSIDPLLVVAVIRTESAFNNYAVSPVGAMGLMQVMPSTAQWLSERLGSSLQRVTNLFDSELNIALGTAYLAELLQEFKQLDAALLAYNAGPVAARRILADRATRKRVLAGYPRKVLREHERLEREAGARPDARDQAPIPDAPG